MAVRLKATDEADLEVIASFLQDAVIPLREMAYQAAESRFALIANRFRWEDAGDAADVPAAERTFERIHCGIRFEGVRAVRTRGIDRRKRDEILSLLTLRAYVDGIELLFAGGGVIRLEVDRILCRLDDLAEPWPTQWRPSHPEDTE